ncbi:MAG: hypothetical protein EOP83_22670 [Verrucomicrobiaceae bacterium]|nr:MAG: hypothetical protein EOP83_22670 [Verrucomicrobiaceae bacterium]
MIPPLNSFRRTLYQFILKSLREHPEDWIVGTHDLENRKLDLTVWIANGCYGMHVKAPNGYKFGDVTLFSMFFGWMTWRRVLLKEGRRLQRAKRKAQENEILARLHVRGRD